jgi:hypothetical protein
MKPVTGAISLMLLFGGVFSNGCSFERPRSCAYLARIERVDQPPGEYYSPRKGHQPLTYLYLRVRPLGRSGEETLLRVAVLGWYTPETHGGAGDAVSFDFPGRLPLAGQLNFGGLVNYRVTAGR